MTADLYCARSDVTRRIPPGSLPSAAGLVASSLAGTNAITYDGHGFETNDPVTVRALEGGSLSAPLVEGTVYYAIRLNNAEFKLAATPSGSAIDLTTDAVSMVVMRDPDHDGIIEFYSRWADAFLPAHVVPLVPPIHPIVKGVVADCSAKRLMNIGGQDSAVLNATELAGKAMLERYAAGLPLRGAPATRSANLAVRSGDSTTDPRGWCPNGSGSLP